MSPELTNLLREAKERVDAMTPEERQAMFEVQRRNMALSYRSGPRETIAVVAEVGEVVGTSFGAPATVQPDYKAILLALCAGLHLSEGSGEVSEDVWRALKLAEITPPDEIDNDSDLADWLAIEHDAESLWTLKTAAER